MFDFYEPDYHEPTTGELVYEEVRQLLLKAVKQQWVDEMERLRKEVEELRPFRDDKLRYEQELQQMKWKYEHKVEEAERNAKKMLMEDLFGENKLICWRPNIKYIEQPKCDKCDDKRKIHFTSPMGKEMTENCSCASKSAIYEPQETHLLRFTIHHKRKAGDQDSNFTSDKPIYRYYAPRTYRDTAEETEYIFDHECEKGCYRPTDTADFENLNQYSAIFTSKERCQEYCDYLTEQIKDKRYDSL